MSQHSDPFSLFTIICWSHSPYTLPLSRYHHCLSLLSEYRIPMSQQTLFLEDKFMMDPLSLMDYPGTTTDYTTLAAAAVIAVAAAMHTFMHTHIHAHTRTYTYIHAHEHTHIHAHTRTHTIHNSLAFSPLWHLPLLSPTPTPHFYHTSSLSLLLPFHSSSFITPLDVVGWLVGCWTMTMAMMMMFHRGQGSVRDICKGRRTFTQRFKKIRRIHHAYQSMDEWFNHTTHYTY